MKRIDVSDVPALFQRTGLKPVRHAADQDDCGCVLQAIQVDSGEKKRLCVVKVFGERRFGYDYAWGIAEGWDGVAIRTYNIMYSVDERNAGYADGRAAAALMFGKEGMECRSFWN